MSPFLTSAPSLKSTSSMKAETRATTLTRWVDWMRPVYSVDSVIACRLAATMPTAGGAPPGICAQAEPVITETGARSASVSRMPRGSPRRSVVVDIRSARYHTLEHALHGRYRGCVLYPVFPGQAFQTV